MDQTLARDQITGGESDHTNRTELCLLSLDGGGVRGLSTLYILEGIMRRLNDVRQSRGLAAVKPCEVFDLIGGTSTGGLIAIMLGRLEMDVSECISEYTELMKTVFAEKSHRMPMSLSGRVQSRFDTKKLKDAIETVITRQGFSPAEYFNDGHRRTCRVFVCAAAKELYGITRLRSYNLPEKPNIPATICEAALAMSAATGFFDPVPIGARHFEDGALGANNPVDEVEGEASDVWCPETGDLKPLVKCFISIGTGNPGKKAIEDNLLKFLSKTLVKITTETEESERKFVARWRQHLDSKRYFRFNVEHGLQQVGLAEYKDQGTIETATDLYLNHQTQVFRVRDCVENLKQRQSRTETTLAAFIHEHNAPLMRDQTSSYKACSTIPFARTTRPGGHVLRLEKPEMSHLVKDPPMGPLSIAASATGMLWAGVKIAAILSHIDRLSDSPPLCRSALDELCDIMTTLRQMQSLFTGEISVPAENREHVLLEHLAAALTGCVMTTDELETVVDDLDLIYNESGVVGIYNPVKWIQKETHIKRLVQRLQNHKDTLKLMMTIFQTSPSNQILNSISRLNSLVEDAVSMNSALWLRMSRLEGNSTIGHPDTEIRSFNSIDSRMDVLKVDSASVGTIIDPSQNQTTKLDETGLIPFSFDLALQSSRVYRKLGIIDDGHSETSMTPSIRRRLAISIFSALSLAEISNLSQFSLPIFIQEISNNQWYAHVGSLNSEPRLCPTVIPLTVKLLRPLCCATHYRLSAEGDDSRSDWDACRQNALGIYLMIQ